MNPGKFSNIHDRPCHQLWNKTIYSLNFIQAFLIAETNIFNKDVHFTKRYNLTFFFIILLWWTCYVMLVGLLTEYVTHCHVLLVVI